MYFCVMNENYVKPTTKQKYIEVEVLNEENVESFRKEIADLEIHSKLDDIVDRDPNYNYEIVFNAQKYCITILCITIFLLQNV